MPISPNDVQMVGVPYYYNKVWWIDANVRFYVPPVTKHEKLLQVVRRQYLMNNQVYVDANVYTLKNPEFERVNGIRCMGCHAIATAAEGTLIVCEQRTVFGTIGEDENENALQRYFEEQEKKHGGRNIGG